MTSRRVGASAAASVLTVWLALTGCGADPIEPGPDAGVPACAQLLQRLPGTVLDRSRTPSDVAGTATWGEPPIVLRCGVAAAGPSDTCIEVNDVDWTIRQTDDAIRFQTFGRNPSVELTVPAAVDRTTAPGALAQLSDAVTPLPLTRRCPAA